MPEIRHPGLGEQTEPRGNSGTGRDDVSKALQGRSDSAEREMKDREAFQKKAQAGRTLPKR